MKRLKYASPEQQARAAAIRAAPSLLLRGAALVLGCVTAGMLLTQWLRLDSGWTTTVLDFALLTTIALPVLYFSTVRTFSEVVARESALAADQRFQAITTGIQDGILVTDDQANILQSNPAAEQIYGMAGRDLAGKNIETLIPPDRLEIFRADLKAARESGVGSITGRGAQEVYGLRANGQRFPMEVSINSVEEPQGLRFVRIVRDISERKRAEREIARLANFARANPHPVFECHPDGAISYANPAAERLLASGPGASPNIGPLIPGFPQLARDCMTQGITQFGLETECCGRVLLWTLQPSEETGRILAFAADITERKKAERAHEQSERQLRDLLDTLPVAVRVVAQEKTVFANAAAAHLFGFARPSEMIGMDPQTLIAEKDRKRLQEYHRRRMAGEDFPPHYEATMIRTDDTEIPVEIYAARFAYEGHPGSLVTLRDLSERKKLQMYEQILPVCCMCGNIRDDSGAQKGQGAWGRLDHYVMRHSDTQLSHTFCPGCLEQYRREQGLA